MAEIVNFRRAKKAKARTENEKRAEQNRAKFGTPKAERDLEQLKAEKDRREHEQNKLEKE